MPIAASKKVVSVESRAASRRSSLSALSYSGLLTNASASDGKKILNEGYHTKQSERRSPNPIPTRSGFNHVNSAEATIRSSTSASKGQWSSNLPTQGSSQQDMPQFSTQYGIRRHSSGSVHVPTFPIRRFGSVPTTVHEYGCLTYPLDYSMVTAVRANGSESGPTNYSPHIVEENPLSTAHLAGKNVSCWPVENMAQNSSQHCCRDYRDNGFSASPVAANESNQRPGLQTKSIVASTGIDDRQSKTELEYNGLQINYPFPCNDEAEEDRGVDESLEMSHFSCIGSIGSTPKLQFCVKYYEKVISPIIVAFDSPTNPFRTHILHLAVASDALQHAIAALSACNFRKRREHHSSLAEQSIHSLTDSPHGRSLRRFSLAYGVLEEDPQCGSNVPVAPSVPSSEELYYKSESIRLMNAQLTDPSSRNNDSVLATLLILCLYHVYNTGVAKFYTQFAGAKKILASRRDSGRQSSESRWITTVFTWFDALSATINDRECQFSREICDMASAENDEWGLENLAGCDRRLFNIIARLGRLNLLGQGRSVSGPSPQLVAPGPKSPPPLRPRECHSMEYSRFDDDNRAGFLHKEPSPIALNDSTATDSQFQHEWTDIHQSLVSWSLDEPPTFPLSPTNSALPTHRLDLLHISESFRYSALLYIERLAHPSLSSASTHFQPLVSQSLRHIVQVQQSDGFLAWPLFVTGVECVYEVHRDMVREKFGGMRKGLGVRGGGVGRGLLEKVWRRVGGRGREMDEGGWGGEGRGAKGCGRGGFWWQGVIERGEGEYTIV